ncbi:MAG: hypothetical protein KC482_02445 [Dehalococcoidia bacterium]|nr:hypothetical protein [Dehalococcoidia bacterium]
MDGQPCRAWPRRHTGLCIFHDPDYDPVHRANSARGGSRPRQDQTEVEDIAHLAVDLTSPSGIQSILDVILRHQLLGHLPVARTNQLIQLLRVAAYNVTRIPQPESVLTDAEWHQEWYRDHVQQLLAEAPTVRKFIAAEDDAARQHLAIHAGRRHEQILLAHDRLSAAVNQPGNHRPSRRKHPAPPPVLDPILERLEAMFPEP